MPFKALLDKITAMEIKSLIQQAQDLINTCPDMPEQSGQDSSKHDESAKQWCEEVAKWTNTLCGHDNYGPKVRTLMNRNIEALKHGRPARKAYDTLVNILIRGYELIEEEAPTEVRIVGEIIDNKVEGPLRAPDFGECAKEIIESDLRDPFEGAIIWCEFKTGLSVNSDPIIEQSLARLHQAKQYLEENMLEAKVIHNNKETNSVPLNKSETPWSKTFSKLEGELRSAETAKVAPWIWLGINMMQLYKLRPDTDVFESLSMSLGARRSIGSKVSRKQRRYPYPDFVKVIYEALKFVHEILPNKTFWQVEKQTNTEKYNVPWEADNDEYIPLNEAVKLAGDDSITVKKMSQLLKGTLIPVHHMHRGRRCKIHLAEFRRWLEYAQHGKITDKAITKHLEGVEKRKEVTRQNKQKK